MADHGALRIIGAPAAGSIAPVSAVNVAEQYIKEGEQGCAGARVVFQRGQDQAEIIWEGEA